MSKRFYVCERDPKDELNIMTGAGGSVEVWINDGAQVVLSLEAMKALRKVLSRQIKERANVNAR